MSNLFFYEYELDVTEADGNGSKEIVSGLINTSIDLANNANFVLLAVKDDITCNKKYEEREFEDGRLLSIKRV